MAAFFFLSIYSYKSTGMKCINHKSKTYNRFTNARHKRIQEYHYSKSSNGIKKKRLKKEALRLLWCSEKPDPSDKKFTKILIDKLKVTQISDKKLLPHNHRGYRWKLDPQPTTIALIKACLFSLVKFSYTLGGGAHCFAGCRAELGHSWPIHQIEYYSVSTTNMGNPWTQINDSWERVV